MNAGPAGCGSPGECDGSGPGQEDDPGHPELTTLLGAWALGVCPPGRAPALREHLDRCAPCAAEAARLGDAVPLLEPGHSLDLMPDLRPRVLDDCLARRPALRPLPSWAAPLDAEAARLDALLDDMDEEEWRAPVPLRWYENDRPAHRTTTVAGVLDHLSEGDAVLARSLRLPKRPGGPAGEARSRWREQTRALVRASAGAGRGRRRLPHRPADAPPGRARRGISVADAFLDRAFACWTHAGDIAEAVDYPCEQPLDGHLRLLVDRTARRLPDAVAGRRRAGLASFTGRPTAAGRPGRTLHLEVEGPGGGHWYVPLDSPAALVSRSAARHAVAHVALEDVAFCRLAAGRIAPQDAAVGQEGDPAAIHDVLFATAALSTPLTGAGGRGGVRRR
ncbi:zf-HC2 domain-containing protein [Streptomyces sodiiphilus]|uniref:Zf-HC2 domain-containing protein n=1 Tax=Streptomyces sodiiphilus TaxID=226217 RepID=A0ABN2P532_9ACTN